MKMTSTRLGLSIVVLFAASFASSHGLEIAANPIRRVVNMLQSMSAKIEEEGKKGEALYEKFMCYCKTSGSSLQQSITESDAKVPQLEASLKEASSQKAQLEQDIKANQEARDAAAHAIGEANAIREKEAAEFAGESSDYSTDVAALTKAIAALEKGMAGSFLQTPAAQVLQHLISKSSSRIGGYEHDVVAAFLSTTEGYAPASGEIVGILKQMKDDMSGDLASITAQEEEAKKQHAELVAAKEHELVATTMAIEEKTKRVGALGVEIVDLGNDIEDTSESSAENKKMLADLGTSCDTKTAEWEEATKTRNEELLAISETIKILNDDDALELFKKTLPSPSLLQMAANAQAQQRKAAAMLQSLALQAKRSSKPAFDLITMALSGRKVNFDKVFKMIDDLIAVLKEEQQADSHKKETCESQIDSTEDKAKELGHDIRRLEAAISDAEEAIATLKAELKALADGIVALDKDVAEATETRKEEHESFSELLSSDAAAKELLGIAKNRLNKFYHPKLFKAAPERVLTEEERVYSNFGGELAPTPAPGGIANTGVLAFAQVRAHTHSAAKQEPTPPESFAPYAKKAEDSNGVIKMIDMLIADLDKEMTEAQAEEKNAQAAYEKFMEDAAEKRAMDSKAITDKEGTKAATEEELQKLKKGDSEKKSELMATEEYLSSLHSDCDWLIKNFELRKSARAGEVESLKAAKAVLAGADYSLVQRAARRSATPLRG